MTDFAIRSLIVLAITLSAAQMPQAPQVSQISASRSAPVIPASSGAMLRQDQTRTGTPNAGLAQQSEEHRLKAEVAGANPVPGRFGVPVAAEGPMPGRAFLRPPNPTTPLKGVRTQRLWCAGSSRPAATATESQATLLSASPPPCRPRTPQKAVAASKRTGRPAGATPAAVTGRIGSVQLGGLAGLSSWYCAARSACTRGYPASCLCAAAGLALRRLLGPGWPGRQIRVSVGSRVVLVRLVDICGCPGGRWLDLYSSVWRALGIELSRGVVVVAIEILGRTK